jgi:hypothetical protein
MRAESATLRSFRRPHGFPRHHRPFKLPSQHLSEALAMRAALMSVIGVLLLGSAAQAQVYHGNDTGGIISWSCENEAMAREIAGDFCARWNKYPRITSVIRGYGNFIAFHCLWSPYVNPYALPRVGTRSRCRTYPAIYK